MNRSTRFISLSGMSGISAGIIGLATAYLAHRLVYCDPDNLSFEPADIPAANMQLLIILGIGFGVLLILSGIIIQRKYAS